MLNKITLINFSPKINDSATVPLGPLYLSSLLEDNNCYVDFRDFQFVSDEKSLTKANINKFLDSSEDTLAISCQFNTLPFILYYLSDLKKQYPNKRIILGGPGPSSVAEDIIRNFKFIDIIVKGEGEQTLYELIKGKPLNEITGIVYRDNDNIHVNPDRERIKNLNALAFPAYHKIDIKNYDIVGIITARGCPYHCSFCEVAPLWNNYNTNRSVDNVIEEIKLLNDKYKISKIHIHDDTFTLNKKWVKDFCENLIKERFDITWNCLGRINLIDEELLAIMAASGCTGIQYGIESGSDKILKRIGKGITSKQILESIKISKKYIKTISSTFIWGYPFEEMADFYETIHFMGLLADLGVSIKYIQLSPSRLSPLFKEYKKYLSFSEELVSNLLFQVLDLTSSEEKNILIQMIKKYPDIFPGFHYYDASNIHQKHTILKSSSMISR